MAYIPAHLLNPLEERWHWVQSDAGTSTPFNNTIDPWCLHSSN